MELRNTTVSTNRPLSGSWSHDHHNMEHEQQHYDLHRIRTNKPRFLTKLIQKRTTNSNDTLLLDDKSSTVHQVPLPPALQQQVSSTPTSKNQEQIMKGNKAKRLGRFLKKLGKNTPTDDTSKSPVNAFTIYSNHTFPSTTDDTAPMQGQTARDLEGQNSDRLPTSATHLESNNTTHSDDQVKSANTAQLPPLYLEALLLTSTTQDDSRLRYHPSNDIMQYTRLMPRSTSFDIHRSRQQSPPPPTSLRCIIPGRRNQHDNDVLSPNNNRNAHTRPLRVTNTTESTMIRGTIDEYSTDDDNNNDIDDDDDDDGSTNDSMDPKPITGELLSKRLSGGHFGSAGGLIINTLSLSDISAINHAPIHQYHHHHHKNNTQPNKNSSNDRHPTLDLTPTATPPILQQEQNEHYQHARGYTADSDWLTDTKISSDSSGLVTPPSGPLERIDVGQYDDSAGNTIIDVDLDTKDGYHDDDVGDNNNSNSTGFSVQPSIITPEVYAKRIWEQDSTVYSNLEHVAEWIGNGSPSSCEILKCYMSYFDFSHLSLEDAFRELCGKLSMKAESQQIDRILASFSKRYWDCNQQSIFGNADTIHAIVYSLVLLNTDLHIAQGERKKMSRSAFVRNTMDAIQTPPVYPQPNAAANSGPYSWESNNISNLSVDDDKRTSNISFDSHKHQQEWNDLNRTPSYRSAYSQNSAQRIKKSSSLNNHYGTYGWQIEMESLLKQLYVSIRQNQIMHLGSKSATSNDPGPTRHSGTFKQNVGARMWKAARDSLFLSDSNVAELEFPQPLSPRSTISSMSGNHPRRASISSMRSGVSHHSQYARSNNVNQQQQQGIIAIGPQAIAPLLHHPDLPESYTNAAPYYKEGLLERKHLMEQANNKARQRDWKQCFVVVDRGELRMYRLESHGQRRKSIAMSSRHPLHGIVTRGASLATVSESLSSCDETSITSDIAIGGGDWQAHAKKIGEIDLKHTLSHALPSGYSRQRRHAFALQQANGGVYLFQVGSAEQALEWATTCNYWAARESKEPLMGGVGNLEYGWGVCLERMADDEKDGSNDDPESSTVTVCQWQPPIPPLMASTLGEMAQHNTLLQHIKALNDELDQHRDLKRKIERRFPRKTPNHICAMINFENKTQYLLHEIIKYQNYCDSIEKSLALQDKAMQEGQEHEDSVVVVVTA